MANDRVEEFLDLYKKLEQLLKMYYANDRGKYESVVVRFENSHECRDHKNELTAIREIRNLLQHNPKVGGRYIVEPSDEIMNGLREVIRLIENPRLAIDFGIKERHIYKATLKSGMMKVLRVMNERGYSHIPVMDNGVLFGVISSYTLFEFITEQGMQILTEETPINAMRDYLPINRHKQEFFLFMSRQATFKDADEAFERRDSKGRRLSAIFITENGRPEEHILAMLTPWSVVGK